MSKSDPSPWSWPSFTTRARLGCLALFLLTPLLSAGYYIVVIRLLAPDAHPIASLAVILIGVLGGVLAAFIALLCWSSPEFVRRPRAGVRSAGVAAFGGWAIVVGMVFTVSPVGSPLAMTVGYLPGAFAAVIIAWAIARRSSVALINVRMVPSTRVPRTVLVVVGVALVGAIAGWAIGIEGQLRPDGGALGIHLLIRLLLLATMVMVVVVFEAIQIGRTSGSVALRSFFGASTVAGWTLVHAPWIVHAVRLDADAAGAELTLTTIAVADTAAWIARAGWVLLVASLVGMLVRLRSIKRGFSGPEGGDVPFDVTSLPGPVRRLAVALSARGFARVAEQHTDRFNFFWEMANMRTRYRFTCDRGQWFIEAGRVGDLFDADVWSALLERTPFSSSLQPIESQAMYFMTHLDEVAAATRREVSALRRLRNRRAEEFLGRAPIR